MASESVKKRFHKVQIEWLGEVPKKLITSSSLWEAREERAGRAVGTFFFSVFRAASLSPPRRIGSDPPSGRIKNHFAKY